MMVRTTRPQYSKPAYQFTLVRFSNNTALILHPEVDQGRSEIFKFQLYVLVCCSNYIPVFLIVLIDRVNLELQKIMSTALFHKYCCHICCVFGAGRHGNNWRFSQKCPQAGSVCKPKKHVPIGGKRHHTNQSQNFMAKDVIWLLRNRVKFWEGWWRKSDSDSDGDRER